MKIGVFTYFDCTATGTTGHFRQARLPMTDRAQKTIVSEQDWNLSRNQQRNFETLLQIIGLYTQPLDLSDPVYDNVTKFWGFEFSVEFEGIFATDADSLGLLKQQTQHVPMITGLTESWQVGKQLDPDTNIFFQELNIIN